MGGHAFDKILGKEKFPRMRPCVYHYRKTVVSQKLKRLFWKVSIPKEAPGKADFGDIDFVVSQPKWPGITTLEIQEELGAQHRVRDPHMEREPGEEEDTRWQGLSHYAFRLRNGKYVQVDVYGCKDADEWSVYMLLHRLGDLGIILKEMAFAYGFTFHKGPGLMFKFTSIANNPNPRREYMLKLSSNPHEILTFFDLDTQQYNNGFSSVQDIYSWFMDSSYCNPALLVEGSRRESMESTLRKRKMYRKFIKLMEINMQDWSETETDSCYGSTTTNSWPREYKRKDTFLQYDDAMDHFEDASVVIRRKVRAYHDVFTMFLMEDEEETNA